MMERTVNAERMEQVIEVFGSFDENIRKIEDAFGVHVINRGEELKVQGEAEMPTAAPAPSKVFWSWPPRERPSTSRRCAISSTW